MVGDVVTSWLLSTLVEAEGAKLLAVQVAELCGGDLGQQVLRVSGVDDTMDCSPEQVAIELSI